MALDLEQDCLIGRGRKVVTGQFRAFQALIGAEVDEIEQRDALGGVLVLKAIAEGISRQAQGEACLAWTFERLDRLGGSVQQSGQGGAHRGGSQGAGEEVSATGGCLHGPHLRRKPGA